MAQLKCNECGLCFGQNLKECPNCGCPSNECKVVGTYENANTRITGDEDHSTRIYTHVVDSEDRNEQTIITFSNVFFFCTFFLSVICFLIILFISDNGITTLLGGIGLVLFVMEAYFVKLFIQIYANISNNLREIKNKIQ